MKRQQQKQQTHSQILQTADRLFQQHGFEQVSTRMIAKESGVGVGTVFAHFADKKALIMALFHSKIEQRLAQYAAKAARANSGLDYFLGYAEFLYHFYQEDRAFSKALLQNALFDMPFFQAQMLTFIAQVALHLQLELSHHDDHQRYIIAKAWFGFYYFHLLSGLSDEQLNVGQWIQGLKADCEALLSCCL